MGFSVIRSSTRFYFAFKGSAGVGVNGVRGAFSAPHRGGSIFVPTGRILSLFGVVLGSQSRSSLFKFSSACLSLIGTLRVTPRQKQGFSTFTSKQGGLRRIVGKGVRCSSRGGR